MSDTATQMRVEMARVNELASRIIDACLGRDSCEGLLDDLRAALERKDRLAAELNGDGENDEYQADRCGDGGTLARTAQLAD